MQGDNKGCKPSLYEACVDQIWPFEVLRICEPVYAALLYLQGQLVYNEEGTTAPPVVCVQPQLIQSNVVNHTHLHTKQQVSAPTSFVQTDLQHPVDS